MIRLTTKNGIIKFTNQIYTSFHLKKSKTKFLAMKRSSSSERRKVHSLLPGRNHMDPSRKENNTPIVHLTSSQRNHSYEDGTTTTTTTEELNCTSDCCLGRDSFKNFVPIEFLTDHFVSKQQSKNSKEQQLGRNINNNNTVEDRILTALNNRSNKKKPLSSYNRLGTNANEQHNANVSSQDAAAVTATTIAGTMKLLEKLRITENVVQNDQQNVEAIIVIDDDDDDETLSYNSSTKSVECINSNKIIIKNHQLDKGKKSIKISSSCVPPRHHKDDSGSDFRRKKGSLLLTDNNRKVKNDGSSSSSSSSEEIEWDDNSATLFDDIIGLKTGKTNKKRSDNNNNSSSSSSEVSFNDDDGFIVNDSSIEESYYSTDDDDDDDNSFIDNDNDDDSSISNENTISYEEEENDSFIKEVTKISVKEDSKSHGNNSYEEEDDSFIKEVTKISVKEDSKSVVSSTNTNSRDDDTKEYDYNLDDIIVLSSDDEDDEISFKSAAASEEKHLNSDSDDENSFKSAGSEEKCLSSDEDEISFKSVLSSDDDEDDEISLKSAVSEEEKSVIKPKVMKKSSSTTGTTKEFQKGRDSLANQFFLEFDELVFDKMLTAKSQCGEQHCVVVWSNKLRTTAGLTRLRTKTRIPNDGCTPPIKIRLSIVELSTKVIDSTEKLRATLLHELCHAAAWIVDNTSKPPHGRCFKKWANLAMRKIRNVEVTTTHTYEIAFKYAWACSNPQCSVIIKRHSRSIDTQRQICGRCKSTFVEVDVKTTTKDLLGSTNYATPKKKKTLSAYNSYIQEISKNVRQQLERRKSSTTPQKVKVTQADVLKECARLWKIEKNK